MLVFSLYCYRATLHWDIAHACGSGEGNSAVTDNIDADAAGNSEDGTADTDDVI